MTRPAIQQRRCPSTRELQLLGPTSVEQADAVLLGAARGSAVKFNAQ